MSATMIQVDAFVVPGSRGFSGNPAGVCLLDGAREDAWMQGVAAEMNLAETAFLRKRADGYDLRWFTPVVEVDLCGHATLASAHALWEQGLLGPDEPARFHTRSGLLTARACGEQIELDFPAEPAKATDPPADLLAGLGGVAVRRIARNRFDYLVELESEEAVRSLDPDFRTLRRLGERGVIATAQSDAGGFDFVSRFFAPACGIDEDPVTGSAHCCLGPWWSERLDRTEFVAFQASARGGVVRVKVNGNRVILGGEAITVFRAELLV